MTNLKRILVATDFSQLGNDAVRRATLLAAREDAELLILHAFPRLSALDTAFSADDDIPRRLREAADANLGDMVKAARTANVQLVLGEIAEGSAHRAVTDVAESFHPDLLVIGAHSKGLLQQFFLGGTAARILANVTCPVLVVRREPADDYREALAAVDLGPRAKAILRAALMVGSAAHVTATHAYQAPFEAKLRLKDFAEKDIARYAELEARTAERNMATLLSDPELAGLDINSRIIHGHPNPVLPEIAEALEADLIVAGRHSGSRLGEMAMGSIARFLAYYAPCDVLVV
ncbi:MAG: universal stress protein [Rugosibacter sp.]|nr:universal stress protein [Rugosibacter sp.]